MNLEKDNTCSLPGILSTQMYLLTPILCLPCASHSGENDESKTEPSILTKLELIFSSFMIPFFSGPSKPILYLRSPIHTARCWEAFLFISNWVDYVTQLQTSD